MLENSLVSDRKPDPSMYGARIKIHVATVSKLVHFRFVHEALVHSAVQMSTWL